MYLQADQADCQAQYHRLPIVLRNVVAPAAVATNDEDNKPGHRFARLLHQQVNGALQ